jgi:hypothetical protein
MAATRVESSRTWERENVFVGEAKDSEVFGSAHLSAISAAAAAAAAAADAADAVDNKSNLRPLLNVSRCLCHRHWNEFQFSSVKLPWPKEDVLAAVSAVINHCTISLLPPLVPPPTTTRTTTTTFETT